MQNLGSYLEQVHKQSPLVHNITNYVTVHDVANAIIACGASPVMTDGAIEDVKAMAAIASGLNVNIGTPTNDYEEVCLKAVEAQAQGSNIIVLDPVGAGATEYRTNLCKSILDTHKVSLIKGNLSEIKALFTDEAQTKGVDADIADKATEDNLDSLIEQMQMWAAQYELIIVATGEIDIVLDPFRAFAVYNGSPMMSEITGSGCMLSGVLTAYVAANPKDQLSAALAALCAFGIAGERAEQLTLERGHGNATFSNYLIDELYLMDAERLDENADYEQR